MNAVAAPDIGHDSSEMRIPAVPQTTEHPFEFHGDASEYFRIWIVNLALSIVTLGVYSAWAKVRTQRYFYGNTRVAGAPFEYLAQPLPILKGRLIAFALFGSYIVSGHFFPKVQLALALAIALFSPWLIVRGLRFRARYSAWRSLNFRFVGTYGDAYVRFLLMYLLVPISLGLAYPYVKAQQKTYMVEELRYGGRAFQFHAKTGDFYPPYLGAFGMIIVWYIVASVAGGALIIGTMNGHSTDPAAIPRWPIYAMVGLIYLGLFFIMTFLASRLHNLVYNNIELFGNRLRSTLRARELIGLYSTNTIAIVFSAGMAIPWTMIRMAKYRASRLTLLALGDLDEFVAVTSAEVGAAGSELDALLDFDLGF